jgi:hypothetical protein
MHLGIYSLHIPHTIINYFPILIHPCKRYEIGQYLKVSVCLNATTSASSFVCEISHCCENFEIFWWQIQCFFEKSPK